MCQLLSTLRASYYCFHCCNFLQEGFNVKSVGTAHNAWVMFSARARLGIIANNENECNTPDSFLGFGTSYPVQSITNSAGNYASAYPDNGHRNIKAMGYIMAR